MKIKVLTHRLGFVESEIPDDFVFLRVTYVTGDEIIEVYCHDEEWGDAYLYSTIDPDCENRIRNVFDCTYIVKPNQLEFWNDRQTNYHIWDKDNFKKSVIGFVYGEDLGY